MIKMERINVSIIKEMNSLIKVCGELFITSTNCHLYNYANNNPVVYTDPDGRAYTKKVCVDARKNHLRYKSLLSN